MTKKLFISALLFNLIFLANSVIQNWDLANAAVDLLPTGDDKTYKTYEGKSEDNQLIVEMYKQFKVEDGTMKYYKYVKVILNSKTIYDGKSEFENIGSVFHINDKNIICPKGSFHPTYYYEGGHSPLSLSDFRSNGDWELKCFHHHTGYFLVFYLMNGNCHFFYILIGTNTWKYKSLHDEIYDFKLQDGTAVNMNDNNEFELAYFVKNKGIIKFLGAKYTFKNDGIHQNDCCGAQSIMTANTYTRGCFENNFDHFYYLSYTNTSDFTCGYFDSENTINKLNVGIYTINKHTESPLEFVDEVEIETIKFIKNYKYAYYIINNPSQNKKYYGIIDTKKILLYLIQMKK